MRLHGDAGELHAALADQAVTARKTGVAVAIAADTREQVAALNAAIRAGMVDAGLVDDTTTTDTTGGERIGVGDTVVTRRNNKDLGVANRDSFTVTAVGPDGSLTVTAARPDGAARLRGDTQTVLPASYVAAHVQLGYASTVHGVQGDTVTADRHLYWVGCRDGSQPAPGLYQFV